MHLALHYIKDIGGATDTMAGWILAVTGLVEMPTMFLVGIYCKHHKKEFLIIPFLLIGASGWILFTLVGNPLWFFPISSMKGLVLSVMFIALTAMVIDEVPKNRVGAALGLLGAVTTIGDALGPAIAGTIIDHVSADAAMITMSMIIIVPTIFFGVYLVGKGRRRSKVVA